MAVFKKILVYGLNFIGDSLFTTPFLHNLRVLYPEAYITVLSGNKGASVILKNNPNINENTELPSDTKQRIDFIKNRGFDVAFILNTSFKAALEVYKAGVNIRVGHKREFRSFLLTHKVKFRKDVHYAENHLRLLDFFAKQKVERFPLEVYPEKSDFKNADKVLNDLNVLEKNVAVFIPGTTNEKKSWGIKKFARLNDELNRRGFVTITIGSNQDAGLCNEINADFNLCGKTSLHELYCLYSYADLIITPDTGPMHIATALSEKNKPLIIALFGPTNPEVYGPFNYNNAFVLRNKTAKMRDISVRDVLDVVDKNI